MIGTIMFSGFRKMSPGNIFSFLDWLLLLSIIECQVFYQKVLVVPNLLEKEASLM